MDANFSGFEIRGDYDVEDDEFFFRLTPGRVLQAVEAAGLSPTGHCTALNALENRVYDIRLDDDRQVVAKFYRPGRWSRPWKPS